MRKALASTRPIREELGDAIEAFAFTSAPVRRSPNRIRLTSICRRRRCVETLDKFLERLENRDNPNQ